MFAKGSRYRNLPQSANVTADGDVVLGVEARAIPAVAGQFFHTVADGERLDLLAFKYYGDSRRWWLIADANRDTASYPGDLLDAHPMVSEDLLLTHLNFNTRVLTLVDSLQPLGLVDYGQKTPDGSGRIDPVATVLVVRHPPSQRAAIVDLIKAAGFAILSSTAWAMQPATEATSFTIADDAIKSAWANLVAALVATPGVRQAISLEPMSRLFAVYNSLQLARAQLHAIVEGFGFCIAPASRLLERTGTRIVIPPDQAG